MSTHGGKRPNSGRKKKPQSEELRLLFDEACPVDQRERIIRSMTARAQAGDSRAAAFIFDRIYGTPISGDELKVREQVEAELDKFFTKIREALPPDVAELVTEAAASLE